MRKRFSVVFTAFAVVFALFFIGAPAGNAATTTLANEPVSASSIVSPDALIRWLPYDYAHQTSQGICIYWMNVLKGYRPDIQHWDCWEYGSGSNAYWLVMVGDSGNI